MNVFSYVSGLQEAILATEVFIRGELCVLDQGCSALGRMLKELRSSGGKVVVVGNGGSAAIASHFGVDLMNVVKVPVVGLSDAALLTCISNDYGYEEAYARPLGVVATEDDVVIAISSSGASANIVQAVNVARARKAATVTFTGFDAENPVRAMGDMSFYVSSHSYGTVELAHQTILHYIIDYIQHYEKDTDRASTGRSGVRRK